MGRTGASGALFPYNWALKEDAWAQVGDSDRAGGRKVVMVMVSFSETSWPVT